MTQSNQFKDHVTTVDQITELWTDALAQRDELGSRAIELEKEVSQLRSLLRRSYDLLGMVPADPRWERYIPLVGEIFEALNLEKGE